MYVFQDRWCRLRAIITLVGAVGRMPCLLQMGLGLCVILVCHVRVHSAAACACACNCALAASAVMALLCMYIPGPGHSGVPRAPVRHRDPRLPFRVTPAPGEGFLFRALLGRPAACDTYTPYACRACICACNCKWRLGISIPLGAGGRRGRARGAGGTRRRGGLKT